MPSFYLLNTIPAVMVNGAPTLLQAGSLITDPAVAAAAQAAGGSLIVSTDPDTTAAALIVAAQRLNKGANEQALTAIMLGAGIQAAFADTPQARGVMAANVANLAAFSVTQDGVTFVQGDRVLLVNQTTAAQNGLYVVGAVSGGTAPITRDPTMPAGSPFVNGQVLQVSEGTLYAGSMWKAMCTGVNIIGTNDPLFYPRVSKGTLTLAAGTKTLGSADGFWLFSATVDPILCSLNTPGGTLTSTTGYHCSARTAGKAGVGAATIIAHVSAGTVNAADTSTVDWLAVNW